MQRLHLVDRKVQPAPPTPKVPPQYFALVATADVTLGEGEYILTAAADDGMRVWLDKEVILDDWGWHDGNDLRPKRVSIVNKQGRHSIKVEFFQAGGSYTLDVNLRSGRRSGDSALA
jgi:hypothetical protein